MTLTPAQNKVLAILAFIVFVPIQLLFLILLISNIFSDETEKIRNAFTFLFVMAILFMPLRWAYITLKRQKVKSVKRMHVSADASTPIKIIAKIDLPQYRKVHFQITYSSSWLIYLHIIAIAMLYFTWINGEGEWLAYAFVLVLMYLPIAVYRSASSNYKAIKMLHETLSYEFSDESLTVKGESFDSTNPWNYFQKVRVLRKWFLLYTNNQPAVYIPKTAFASREKMDKFIAMSNKIG